MEHHDHDKQSPDNKTPTKSPKKFWRSPKERENDPEWQKIVDREFQASPFFEGDVKESWNRRDFMKLMGASLALGSTSCIRRPVQTIIPYVNRPVEITPGIANYYASTWSEGTEGFGLLVKTREGRPIKLEGNPDHPVNAGALSARAQAQVLNLYDPERLDGPRKYNPEDANPFRHEQHPSWSQADQEILPKLKEGGIVLLTNSISSPSTNALIGEFTAATGSSHVVWDPIGYDDVAQAQKSAYGTAVVPRYILDRAKIIVSIDADFLGTYLSPTEFNRQYATIRKPGKDMAKIAVFESVYTLTGANADHRIKIKPSQQLDVVMGLIHQISVFSGKGGGAPAYANAAEKLNTWPELFREIAKDLWENRGRGLVIAGGLSSRTEQSEAVLAAVNFLNSLLGNDGVSVDHANAPHKFINGSHTNLAALIEKMNAGQVKTLIIHGVNPVYQAAGGSGFEEALKKVGLVLYLGDRADETGKYAKFILPDHHHLENWGDSEIQENVFGIQQPTIRPLYNTRAFQDTLLTWMASFKSKAEKGEKVKPVTWFNYLKDNWKKNRFHGAGGFDHAWVQLLKLGVLDLSGQAREKVSTPRNFSGTALKVPTPRQSEGLELVLFESVLQGDGRSSNNSWLQELPDPVTKVSWGNPLLVSPILATKMGLSNGSVVRLTANKQSVKTPIFIQPGLHDEVVAIAVGYGRTAAGEVGTGVGLNAFELASFNKGHPIFSGIQVQIENTGETETIASMQEHANIEGRQIVVETSLSEYLRKPDSGIEKTEVFSIWDEHKYTGYRWGMAIDLNSCTGCSACIIACQAENNIPVVGKRYVIQGREMHWLRVDRYYSGDVNNPRGTFQPLPCQHCENAPCETVCPVAATNHSSEGLNDMVYNRCVGTRYCSNNCPYKVRRFNWFNYANKIPEPKKLQLNPDVTVRTRGVMEKCTFCIQRITSAKNDAKDRGDEVKDGEIKTACQQTCPTNAIVFGNMNDAKSEVRQWQGDPRAFALLEDLNVKPSVRYLTKLKNAKVEAKPGEGHEGGHV